MAESLLDSVLDKDIVDGLHRLVRVPGFDIGFVLSEGLRPFVEMFLPLAELYEEGSLSPNLLLEFMTPDNLCEALNELESLVLKAEAAKAKADKDIKGMVKHLKGRGEK